MRIPSELQMVGGLLNDTRTRECRNQEPFPQNSKTKSFKFSALFFSVVFSLWWTLNIFLFAGQALWWDTWKRNAVPHLGGLHFQSHWVWQQPITRVSWHVPLPGLARAVLASCPSTWCMHTVRKPSTEQRRRENLHGRAAGQLPPGKG